MSADIHIYNEDCQKTMKRIPTGSVNLILQDPPYGVTRNEWDNKLDLFIMWPEWERIIKPNGAIIFFAQQPFVSELVSSRPKLFRYDLIWHKPTGTGFLNAKRMPLRNHEHILVFYKRLPTYNPQKTSGHIRKVTTVKHKENCIKTTNYGIHKLTNYDSTNRYPTSVLRFSTDKQKQALHPTQKPVDLLRYLIRTYSKKKNWSLTAMQAQGVQRLRVYWKVENS